MGYTILLRQQISPATVIIHGVDGPEVRPAPVPPPVYPPSFIRQVWADISDLYGVDPTKRVELWESSIGDATAAEINAACPGLRQGIIDQVKEIRKQALAATVNSAGILAVYDENYLAAVAVREGRVTEVMKNGMTTGTYMAGFGVNFGMDPLQFADFIIGENRKTVSAYQVEQEYLRLAYTVAPACTDIATLLALPADFRRFCGL